MDSLPELPRISDYVFHHAQLTPDREALVGAGQRLSYAAFAAEVRRVAGALLAAGVRPGERVAMLCSPRPEYFVTFLATAAIGGVWVGLHPRYQLGELRHALSEARPRVLIGLASADGRDYRADYAQLASEFDCIRRLVIIEGEVPGAVTFGEFLAQADNIAASQLEDARARVGADDTALIIFTSGSTGAPKGAMLRHYGLVHGARMEHRHWFAAAPVVLCNLPPNHIAGVGMTAGYGLVTGSKIVFQSRFDARGVLELIARERVTFWLQAPTMFHLALAEPQFAQYDLSSLEYIIWAGSPMAYDLVGKLERLGVPLATAFGMTELSTYVTYSDRDATQEVLAGTIGRPDPGYQLRLADADGGMVPVGTEGEIQACGRWLMNGYFNRPEETAAAFTADGWFRTGDLAVAQPDGNWKIVGRTREVYKSGGYSIFPREIEIALERHPAIAMAAVVGVPDPLFNEVGYAFVEPEPGMTVTADTLRSWCHELMANYKVPKHFTVMPQLPRLAIGKIDKVALRRLACGDLRR